RSASSRTRIVDADDVLERPGLFLIARRIALGCRRSGAVRWVGRDIDSNFCNRRVDRVFRNLRFTPIALAGEEIRGLCQPRCPASHDTHLEYLARRSPADD